MTQRHAAVLALAAAVGLVVCGHANASTAECGTYTGQGCAPESQRVDLAKPSFSHPTQITNPLNPISRLRSVVLLGHIGAKRLRTETTLLPGAQTISWDGQRVKALTSQYMAWLNGRIEEVALDWYAQDDAGAVWYLGEDVFDYADGAVDSTEGTWLAGREGPAAMIMPAHPAVGDAYRTENVPGIVFEEVTVKSSGQTVAGPRGRVGGAIVVSELHLDGSREDKIFAPGYGEFRTGSDTELEALAIAVPTDALPGPAPAALQTLSTGAEGVVGSAQAEDWNGATATLARMTAAWAALRAGGVPPLLETQMDDAFRRLVAAIKAHRPVRAGLAAIDVGQANLDVALRYRPPAAIDRARFHLWASRILLHATGHDRAGVASDVATLEWVRDRIAHTLRPVARRELDMRLRDLRAATDAGNLSAAADHAARLAARLRGPAAAY
jgi:hypothetical protein